MLRRLEPDFVVDARGDVHDGPVLLDDDRVVAIGAAAQSEGEVVALPGRMLMPGFLNAHSHAFQRVFRGRVERKDPNAERDDFWSWRTLMYAAALALDLDEIEAVARWCYLDMLKSGFVGVGEFHYLHHGRDGLPYDDDPVATSRRLVAAADAVGIRVALLQTAYARAGHGRGPSADQRRFVFPNAREFLRHAKRARADLHGARVSHGLAAHSVRACPREWIEALAAEADDEDLPLHVHACEQPAELEACREEHGMAPLALLADAGALKARTTVVHATHLDEGDPARLAGAEATVCLCPSTERNLGDGLCPIAELVEHGVPLAVGTDSHARIDVADELRSLEDHERLRLVRRAVLVPPGGSLRHVALPAATTAGARSLGLETGLDPGSPADLTCVRTPVEISASREAAVDAWLTGGSGADVRDVFVAGEHVLADGRPTRLDEDEVLAAVRPILHRLS